MTYTKQPRWAPAGLIALALGGFGIGLTEFVIVGLLPEVAADFAVSIPKAGQLVSGYALAVGVGGVVITALAASLRPKPVLIGLMGLFIAGNLLNATAPSYSLMMTGRIVAALCHGAFFGIGAVLAASLVAESRKAWAISIMFLGLTLANVLGVPLGTFLGQQWGWRSTFWAITGIGVIAALGLIRFIPGSVPAASAEGGLRGELRAFKSGQVWASILITVLGFGAMFGAFTYIAPLLTEVSGLPAGAVPWMLVLFGGGLFIGNLAGGKAADKNLDKTLIVLLAGLAVVLGVFFLVASWPVPAAVALFAMGAVGFGLVPGMQLRVLFYAAKGPTLASGVNIAAFNVGNAIGAHLGGMTIDEGYGHRSPLLVGAGLTVAALIIAIVAAAKSRTAKAAPSPEPAPRELVPQ